MKIKIDYVTIGIVGWLHANNYRGKSTYFDKKNDAYALKGYEPPGKPEPTEGLVQGLKGGWKHSIDAIHVELATPEQIALLELQDAELLAFYASVSPELAERFQQSRKKYKYLANGCYRRSVATIGAIALRARNGVLDDYLVPIEIVTYATDFERSLAQVQENSSKAEAVEPGSLAVYRGAKRIFAAGGSAADLQRIGIKKGSAQKFQYANELNVSHPTLRLDDRYEKPETDSEHLTFSRFDHAFLGELRKETAKDGTKIDTDYVGRAFIARQTGEQKREKRMIEREKVENLSKNSPSTLVRDVCSSMKDGEVTTLARIAELPAIGRLWDLLGKQANHPIADEIEKAHREAFPELYASAAPNARTEATSND